MVTTSTRGKGTVVAQVIVEKEFKNRADAEAWAAQAVEALKPLKADASEEHYWS